VNGIRPQTRYSYTQRYAWISNGSGGYVQAATPVWLLTAESSCRTSAWNGTACTVANDEVVTTYDYGPNSGPNNLLLRGKVVTANGISRRTCFAYDGQGNRIAETKPRAGLTSCP
jgi:YD repeat-containing protein